MTKKIHVRIENGKAIVEFDGYQGEECYKEWKRAKELLESKGIHIETTFEQAKEEAGQIVQTNDNLDLAR